jgi:hypothetical protein
LRQGGALDFSGRNVHVKTFANFSDENPSVHLLLALVRRRRYLRCDSNTGQFDRVGLEPSKRCAKPSIMHARKRRPNSAE